MAGRAKRDAVCQGIITTMFDGDDVMYFQPPCFCASTPWHATTPTIACQDSIPFSCVKFSPITLIWCGACATWGIGRIDIRPIPFSRWHLQDLHPTTNRSLTHIEALGNPISTELINPVEFPQHITGYRGNHALIGERARWIKAIPFDQSRNRRVCASKPSSNLHRRQPVNYVELIQLVVSNGECRQ